MHKKKKSPVTRPATKTCFMYRCSSQKYWRHTVLARHATQQNVVGESKNMKHVKITFVCTLLQTF